MHLTSAHLPGIFAILQILSAWFRGCRARVERRARMNRDVSREWQERGRFVHVSLMWKMFFLFGCSNRDAVPTIRVGADATPPLEWRGGQHGEEGKGEDRREEESSCKAQGSCEEEEVS